jgi:uncharacterized protein
MAEPELIILADRLGPDGVRRGLLSGYSPEQAGEIEALLIRATVELAVGSWPGPVSLYGQPDAFQRGLAEEFGVALAGLGAEKGGHFSTQLALAVERSGAAAVMGCEVPHCPWEVLDQANDWLVRGRNVLGSTEDGGCYFIGLTRADPRLFEGVDRESPRASTLILAHAEDLDVEFELLPVLHAVLTPHDLWLIAQSYEPLRRFVH